MVDRERVIYKVKNKGELKELEDALKAFPCGINVRVGSLEVSLGPKLDSDGKTPIHINLENSVEDISSRGGLEFLRYGEGMIILQNESYKYFIRLKKEEA